MTHRRVDKGGTAGGLTDPASLTALLDDSIYCTEEAQQEQFLEEKPWQHNARYFVKVKISALALTKMVMHACSETQVEVMGLMQGKIVANTFVILDAFALPVTGTETRVNAGAESNEYIIAYRECCEQLGRVENICGWYHTHPGYGCWLSGIDIQTQLLYQQHQEPFLAIVIDPLKTLATNKVDIGAFRCFPATYNVDNTAQEESDDGDAERQVRSPDAPLQKIVEFGLHYKQYYCLSIDIFCSAVDKWALNALRTAYWIDTLGSTVSPQIRAYRRSGLNSIAAKCSQVANDCSGDRSLGKDTSAIRSRGSLQATAIEGAKLTNDRLLEAATDFVRLSLFS